MIYGQPAQQMLPFLSQLPNQMTFPQMSPQQQLAAQYGRTSRAFYQPGASPYGHLDLGQMFNGQAPGAAPAMPMAPSSSGPRGFGPGQMAPGKMGGPAPAYANLDQGRAAQMFAPLQALQQQMGAMARPATMAAWSSQGAPTMAQQLPFSPIRREGYRQGY